MTANRILTDSIARLTQVITSSRRARTVALALGLSLAPSAFATPGSVDPSIPDYNFNYVWHSGTDSVRAAISLPDGRVVIAGFYNGEGRIHRINLNGTLDASFDVKTDGQVYALAAQSDGKILVGGSFANLDSDPGAAVSLVARGNIARLNADGTLDTAYDPNASGTVSAFAFQPDGKVIVGGGFGGFSPNGGASVTTGSLGRLNPDGSVDLDFRPNPSGSVSTVLVQPDGKVVAGGFAFTSVTPQFPDGPGALRNRIFRANADGTLDMTFNPNANGPVQSMALQPDGKIIIGGQFTALTPNGAATATARNRVARLNTDGTLDTGFVPTLTTDFNALEVRSLAMQADGKIILAGKSSGFAIGVGLVSRLNADGTSDYGFSTTLNPIPNLPVDGAMLQADGRILVGGQFYEIGSPGRGTRTMFARLLNNPATQSLTAPDNTRLLWSRGGTAGDASSVAFEQSLDGGATWTSLGVGTRAGSSADWEITGLSLPPVCRVRGVAAVSGGRGNGSVSRTVFTAPIPADSITQAPTLTAPAASTTSDSPVSVNFTLPEAALPGSVELAFNSGTANYVLRLTGETVGTHSFAFDRRNPAGSAGVFSGEQIPDGTYTVSISYQDEWGNPRAAASTSNVTIDAAPETIIVTGTEDTTSTTATFVITSDDPAATFTAQLDGGAPFVVTNPIILPNLAVGAHTISVVATDTTGHTDPTPATRMWAIQARGANPNAYTLAGTKLDPGLPESELPYDEFERIGHGATWTVLGSPAVDDSGKVTFVGKWKSTEPAPIDGESLTGTGIFSGPLEDMRLLVAAGDDAYDENGDGLGHFKALKDPAVSPAGICFAATLDLPTTSDAAYFYRSHATGRLHLITLEGQEMPGAPGSKLKAVSSAVVDGASVLVSGTLLTGPGGVTSANDTGVWLWKENGTLVPIVREGSTIGGSTSTVKSFNILKAASGSPGTGRGLWGGGTVTFTVVFTDGSSAMVDADTTGADLTYVSSTAATISGTGATWKAFGPPATPGYGAGVAFLGTLNPVTGEVAAANAKRIFHVGSSVGSVVMGTQAPGLPVGNLFSIFKDPVISPDGKTSAFIATAKLGTTATTGIWAKRDGQPLQNAIATIGGSAPAPNASLTWTTFTSLAATDFGPVFTATLSDATNGLWAVDSTGTLRQLLRTGETNDGKTIKTITVIKAATGSIGARRSYSGDGQIAALVSFTDASTQIIKIELP